MFQLIKQLVFLTCASLFLALSGCSGSSSLTENSSAKENVISPQTPSPGKSIVYVLKDGFFLERGSDFLFFNGKNVGEINGDNYFIFEVWPGEHHLIIETSGGLFRNGFTSLDTKLTVNQPDSVYVFNIPISWHSTFSLWSSQPNNLSGRTLGKFLSAEQTAQVRRLHGEKWNGPAKNGYANGVGTLTFSDGRVYRGPVERGKLKAEGVLEYPNGNTYKGSYHYEEPDGMGVLSDQAGNILFSGNFSNGKPNGEGARVENGQTIFTHYRWGNKVETDPETLAEKAVSKEDEQALKSVGQSTQIISKDIADLENQLTTAQRRFRRQEDDMPNECRCAFKVCLESWSSDTSYEERKAIKAERRQRDIACREWRNSGGSVEERRANLDRELASSKKKLNSLLSAQKIAEAQDAAERRQKIAEQEKTRQTRIANQKRMLEIQQMKNLEAQRSSCKGKESYCGCAAFRPKSLPEATTCVQ
jgi:hypothetical protein